MLKTFASSVFLALGASILFADTGHGVWNFSNARVGQVFSSETSSTCGGAVVGVDLILTAAHCVIASGSAEPVDPRSVTFSYADADAQIHAVQVIDIATDPEFKRSSAPSREQIARDVALLRLSSDLTIGSENMAALDSSQPFVALLPTDEEAPFEGEPCAADYEDAKIVVLSCARAKGSSGMPAYSLINGERKIVAVVSANGTRRGEAITFAVNPMSNISALRWISATRPIPSGF